MARRLNIFFIHQANRSFFNRDIRILRDEHELEVLDNFPFSWRSLGRVISGIRRADLVILWFLGRHSVLPLLLAKLLRRPVWLIAGGWDVANCPEIDSGLMQPWARLFFRPLFRLPNLVLSVSESNRREALENALVPASRLRKILLGFEETAYSTRQPRKEDLVLTVGDINRPNLLRKGIEPFVRAAAHFPRVPFLVIGRWARDGAIDELRRIAPANVRFTDFLPDDEMHEEMLRAKVYAQLSYHEAFGCSLAEAMLHQCVPVVTDQYALPEVVGDAGYVVPFGSEAATVEAIRAALADGTRGPLARKRVLELFPLERRRRELLALIAHEGPQ